MNRRILAFAILSTLAACDAASDDTTALREKFAAEIESSSVALTDAIATAEAASGGVAVEAKLELEHGAFVYRVEVVADAGQRRIEISSDSGEIVRDRASSSGNADEAAANAELATGADWAALAAAAEAHVGGEVFELEADDGVFEAKVMVDTTVMELELAADGTVLKSQEDDDFGGESEDESEHESEDSDDDHHGGNDDGT
ncbi:MAG: PepSY domain-containing protein [Deltaproteobacteria bacterium]|nr:PepSY domain-containing protein [Deltaproteobacteria bacterium]